LSVKTAKISFESVQLPNKTHDVVIALNIGVRNILPRAVSVAASKLRIAYVFV